MFFKKVKIYFLAARPVFLTASAAPVLVGSALGFTASGEFDWLLFALALFSIMLFHCGANVANDYFDHKSGNDWLNKNPTPFSGGRRFIQDGTLSPKQTLNLSLFYLALGAAAGLVIVLITGSLFILILGLSGLVGGFFYTAPPLKLDYRSIGEVVIAFLFGILPVTGAYFLQTGRIDFVILPPALIVALLIFLVILINEFPDRAADAKVGKKTLVVTLHMAGAVRVYRAGLIVSYLTACASIFIYRQFFYAGLFYLFTAPLAVAAIRYANKKELSLPGKVTANRLTILLHTLGCLALTAGFIFDGFKTYQ